MPPAPEGTRRPRRSSSMMRFARAAACMHSACTSGESFCALGGIQVVVEVGLGLGVFAGDAIGIGNTVRHLSAPQLSSNPPGWMAQVRSAPLCSADVCVVLFILEALALQRVLQEDGGPCAHSLHALVFPATVPQQHDSAMQRRASRTSSLLCCLCTAACT